MSDHPCPIMEHPQALANLDRKEWRVGPLSVGDIIALAGIVFACGILWVMVERNATDLREVRARDVIIEARVGAVELSVSNNYVKRDEYRQDTQRIMDALARIESEVKQKVDKTR